MDILTALICQTFEPCDVLEHLGHFDGIVPSLACIVPKQHGVLGRKYLLKTSGNTISETLIFKMSLDASALENLFLWCRFQSHLVFIISLLLKNFLTALDMCPSVHQLYIINSFDQSFLNWNTYQCSSH